jgi:gluconolactonase
MIDAAKRLGTCVVLAVILLVSANLVMAQPAAAKPRHNMSEICDACIWEKVANCSGFMEGINIDRSGNIFMVGCMTGDILKVEGNKCVTIGKAPAPNGAKFHKDGRFFVTDRSAGLIAIDPKTGAHTTVVSSYQGEPFKALNDLVFDNEGGIYFTDPTGSNAFKRIGRVFYLAPGSSSAELLLSGIAYPNGIALSANGQRVYIAEFGLNRIVSMPTKTAKNKLEPPFIFANLEGGIGPDGLAVDSEGNVYAAHLEAGEIVVLDADGFSYGTLRLPSGAGKLVTNVALHGGYLYAVEAMKNEVWRVKIKKSPLPAFGD